MKLKLSVGDIPFSGYLNIDPIPQATPANGDLLVGDPRILNMVETSECTEILAPDILDYIHISQLIPFIQLLVSKLRHGGRLIIGGTDLHTLSRCYMIGEIKTEDLVNKLYGDQFGAWKNKCGAYPMHEIVAILKELGLQIVRKNLTNDKMFVEGVRA